MNRGDGRIAIEFTIIFVLGPLIGLIRLPSPVKLSLLLLVAMYCVWRLHDRPHRNSDRIPEKMNRLWNGMVWRTGIFLVAAIAITVWFVPESLFSFPQTRPLMWLAVMILYPWLSALPQEIVYRQFFFRFYRGPFPAVINALFFAWLHIGYLNLPALALSMLGSLVLTGCWRKSRGNLAAVTLEHAVYGLIIFTVGLGRYFYRGN